MQRRDFLKTIPLSLSLPGYFNPDKICMAGKGEGKNIFLYNYVESALCKRIIVQRQLGPDCVSRAGGVGIEFVQAIQHFLNSGVWYGQIATEILHAGTLIKICPKSRKRKNINIKGGITIHELILFLKEYGVLFCRKYKDFNFTNYNYDNVKQLLRGIPPHLLEECKKHSVRTTKKITDWGEAKEAIFNLQPVIIGASVGFDDAERDKDGFAKPKGKWYHAWLLIGIIDKNGERKGGCLLNPHGSNWVKGPKKHGQPDGSIFVDIKVLNKMLSEWGDSYAISNFN